MAQDRYNLCLSVYPIYLLRLCHLSVGTACVTDKTGGGYNVSLDVESVLAYLDP